MVPPDNVYYIVCTKTVYMSTEEIALMTTINILQRYDIAIHKLD